MKFKLLIIDPVGKKAGMDYYDDNLGTALLKQDVKVYIASNYINSNGIVYLDVFDSFVSNKILKGVHFFTGVLKSVFYGRKNKVQNVLVHIFSTEIKDVVTTLIASLFFKNLIIISHDISGFNKGDSNLFKGIIYSLANKIIVHNAFSKVELLKSFEDDLKINSKINVIPHGSFLSLPDPKVTRELARQKMGFSANKKYILFFGQIKKVKGLDRLIRSFSKCESTDLELVIAGKPWKDNFDKYQELINEYELHGKINLQIRFIEDDEREYFFKACDVLVLPYRKIYQSGVLLMAMSYGIPVIASNLEPNAEIISHGVNGWLFDTEHDLTNLLDRFSLNKEQKNKITANGLKTMNENFNWNDIAFKYVKNIVEL
jgi:glycosyltransferase involved in cell wall biosynthesis